MRVCWIVNNSPIDPYIPSKDIGRKPSARRLPDRERARAGVAPQQIAHAIAVVIASASEAPAGSNRTNVNVRSEPATGRLPFGERVPVLPDQIASAVAVKIADPCQAPAGCNGVLSLKKNENNEDDHDTGRCKGMDQGRDERHERL